MADEHAFRHRLVTAGGAPVHVVEAGDPGAPPFLFLHGWPESFPGLARAVIMDVVVPGVPPWEEVLRNPYIWHFAFHAIPGLPERLVQGHQAEYFDFFFDVLAADAGRITPVMRAASAQAYAADDALAAGFGWYRAFAQDAADNARSGPDVTAPVLYLRGEHESGRLADYVSGLRAAGLTRLSAGLVPGAGHFSQEEAPAATWRLIADFAAL